MSNSKQPKTYIGESYDAVHRRYLNGMVSERDWRLFNLLWTWSAPRFGGDAGRAQDRVYQRCGALALERRIARAHAHLTRLSGQSVSMVA